MCGGYTVRCRTSFGGQGSDGLQQPTGVYTFTLHPHTPMHVCMSMYVWSFTHTRGGSRNSSTGCAGSSKRQMRRNFLEISNPFKRGVNPRNPPRSATPGGYIVYLLTFFIYMFICYLRVCLYIYLSENQSLHSRQFLSSLRSRQS